MVLQRLAAQPGQAVSRQNLVLALGQDPQAYDYRRMEVLVRRLRNKVRDSAGVDLPLETVHRLGYAFVATLHIH
jgi:DNA-binding response OmpR family regulator